MNPTENDVSLRFDEILMKIRQIVARLEQGQLPLEQALLAFEEGVRLSKQASQVLDAAEHRIELLTKGEQGQMQVEPLSLENLAGGG